MQSASMQIYGGGANEDGGMASGNRDMKELAKDYDNLDQYVTKTGSYKNQSANHLLAFTYKDEEAAG